MKHKKFFKSGDLVRIKLEGLVYTEDGFAMCSPEKSGFSLYRSINMETYPSCDDFQGETTIVNENDLAIVVRYAGRPMQIPRDPKWFYYDIYEIIIKGQIRQIFVQNLEAI